jgi:hypothetical protein
MKKGLIMLTIVGLVFVGGCRNETETNLPASDESETIEQLMLNDQESFKELDTLNKEMLATNNTLDCDSYSSDSVRTICNDENIQREALAKDDKTICNNYKDQNQIARCLSNF